MMTTTEQLREVAETVNGYITDKGWNSDMRNMAITFCEERGSVH